MYIVLGCVLLSVILLTCSLYVMHIGPHKSSGSHNIIVSTHLNSIPGSEGVVLPKAGGLTPEGRYIYMDDLLKLDACRPPQAITVPPRVDSINTPLHL